MPRSSASSTWASTLKLNTKVDASVDSMKAGRFDAAFLAVGAHIAKRAYIPAGSAAKVLDAVIGAALAWKARSKPMLGRRVVVYGGGNTALDVARTAKRLGATEAIIVYRRTRESMPAHDFEVEEALAGRRHDQMALDHQTHGRGRAHRRKDGARRNGLPAADRRVRDAGGRLAGAGARPGRRSVAARRRAGAGDQGRHRAGRRAT